MKEYKITVKSEIEEVYYIDADSNDEAINIATEYFLDELSENNNDTVKINNIYVNIDKIKRNLD